MYLVLELGTYLTLNYILFADFYNWNRVKVRYCDGASFSGDSQIEVCERHIRSSFQSIFMTILVPIICLSNRKSGTIVFFAIKMAENLMFLSYLTCFLLRSIEAIIV